MKVHELIAKLEDLNNKDAEIVAYDVETDEYLDFSSISSVELKEKKRYLIFLN